MSRRRNHQTEDGKADWRGWDHSPVQGASVFGAFPPLFGSVYYGPIPCFAGGAPHFAMVRTRRHEGFSGYTVAVSPITSRHPDQAAVRYCLELPHETLPIAYKAGTGVRKLSWVLLPMIIRVPMSHLRDGMESVLRLKTDLLHEAEVLLDNLN